MNLPNPLNPFQPMYPQSWYWCPPPVPPQIQQSATYNINVLGMRPPAPPIWNPGMATTGGPVMMPPMAPMGLDMTNQYPNPATSNALALRQRNALLGLPPTASPITAAPDEPAQAAAAPTETSRRGARAKTTGKPRASGSRSKRRSTKKDEEAPPRTRKRPKIATGPKVYFEEKARAADQTSTRSLAGTTGLSDGSMGMRDLTESPFMTSCSATSPPPPYSAVERRGAIDAAAVGVDRGSGYPVHVAIKREEGLAQLGVQPEVRVKVEQEEHGQVLETGSIASLAETDEMEVDPLDDTVVVDGSDGFRLGQKADESVEDLSD